MGLDPAIQFLDGRFRPGSGWHEYRTLAGVAINWPTAYVGDALLNASAEPVARQAVGPLLADQQDNGGWGYHTSVPDDCDSTAYAIAFLSAVPKAEQAVQRAADRLIAQQRDDGGFATYGDGSAIRGFMELSDQIPLDGWVSAHPEVTAAAGIALLRAGRREAAERAWAKLVSMQRADGSWHSYWWTTDLYASAMAVLLAEALEVGSENIARARAWCSAQQSDNGAWLDDHSGNPSTLATAFGLLLTGRDYAPEGFAAGEAWLLARQRRDGGWDGEFALRMSPPFLLDPTQWTNWQRGGLGAGAIVRDETGTYVTATVLKALSQ